MRLFTISLIIGIIVGAAYLYVVPTSVWLMVVLTLLIATIWIRNRRLTTVALCAATSIIGIIRISQNMETLERELRNGNNAAAVSEWAGEIREKLKDGMIAAGVEGEALSISAAMTLGDKTMIDQSTRDTYSRSGASHVLAMSGMHLSIIYALLVALVMWLPKRLATLPLHYLETHDCSSKHARRMARISRHMPDGITIRRTLMIPVIITIWTYTLIAGMSPSLTRAATMLTIASLAFVMQRKVRLSDSVTLAAFVMLLTMPLSLYDVGFQMSFLAVLGIGIYYHPIYALLPLKRASFTLLKGIWGVVALTVSVQVLVAPFVAYYFHYVSCYGILTNIGVTITALLIVWTGAVLLILSVLSTVPVFAGLSSLVARLLTVEVRVQNGFLDWVACLPYSAIEGVSISMPQLLLIYIIIGAVTIVCIILAPSCYKGG